MAGIFQYRWHQIALPLVMSGLMLSCSPLNPLGWASEEQTKIGELSQVRNQKVVYLQGIVVNVAPFLNGGAYQLQDATGTVWIKTDRPLPSKGKTLTVKGELAYQAIFVGQEKLGESYILELSQELDNARVIPQSVNTTSSPSESPSPGTIVGDLSPESPAPIPPPIPSPSPTAVTIPVTSPENTQPEVKPSPKPSPTVKPSPKATPTPKPTAKPPTQANPKFNPDDQFLPHKSLRK